MDKSDTLINATRIYKDIEARWEEAIECCNSVLSVEPNNAEALKIRHKITQTFFPDWHNPMIKDHVRNQCFIEAFKRVDWSGKTVLEIGTGSGLLAMLLINAGAEHVYTCESIRFVAHTAKDVIDSNGLGDRISVIAKRSTEVEVGRDLPFKADVLVTETFGADLLNESVVSIVKDAHQRLLSTNALVIPHTGGLVGCLFSSESIRNFLMVSDIEDFDLSEFNSVNDFKHFQLCDASNHLYDFMSDLHTLLSVNFQQLESHGHRYQDFRVSQNGYCDGVLYWMDISLDETNSFSSKPTKFCSERTHWRQCVFLFNQRRYVKQGDKIRINTFITDDFIRLDEPVPQNLS